MKKRKLLSIVLVAVMLFSSISICASAETGLTVQGKANVDIKTGATFDPETFNIELNINRNLIGTFDTTDAATGKITHDFNFEYEITAITTTDGNTIFDYLTNPEEFLAFFTSEDFNGGSIGIEFTVKFDTENIFGKLEYTVSVDGFAIPIDMGDLGGVVGDIGANIPTTLKTTGTVDNFPSIIASSVSTISVPKNTDYLDSEKYDASGLVLSFTTSTGATGEYTYSEETAYSFNCIPSASQNLSCGDSFITVMIIDTPVFYSPISVSHDWSDGPVNITTYKYTDENPGFHAIVCEGCGETHTAEPHIPANAEWTSNNDQTFVANGTESNECAACGTVLTRNTFGTADYNTAFGDLHFLLVIFDYINVLLRFIGAAID